MITSSITGQPAHELQVDDAAVDKRIAAMAEALATALNDALDAAEPYRVRERLEGLGGLPALLHPYTGPAPSMTPIEHLTHRYAVRVGGLAAVEAWRQRLAVLDPPAAVEAALADADADRATRLAVVALLGDLRRALEAQERAAMDRAMELDDVSYTDLGRALGVARQVAHRRHQARAADRPVRLSPQR
ncbi:hypothetical protein ACQEU5_21945 [Marinactinospora thermotolerans]|uniref:hypothetical protein n=1 Tax=Marinactinospora thermotolerans TaxID=531310 RepID=UPI00099A9024|nr:hypothetical protein [Marinactinospora thermotolerans]